MHLFYVHGLGGGPQAQPEIEHVFAPLGYTIIRQHVPYHDRGTALVTWLATLTFGQLCLMIHDTANAILERAKSFAPNEYGVIGDSLGGFIATVAAQRDPRIGHCILLACSGDVCHAVMHLDRLIPGLGLVAGLFNPAGNGVLQIQAHKAIAGQSDFQQEFELINPFQPGRRTRIRRLLILGDAGDPLMPEAACRRFASGVQNSTVVMPYHEARHHPIGKAALIRYAVPFLRNTPLSLTDRVRQWFSSLSLNQPC